MPERSSKKKRPRDVNQLAGSIVDDATGESLGPPEAPDGKNAAAVALGRLGFRKGGASQGKETDA